MQAFENLLTINPVTAAERRISVDLLRDVYLAPSPSKPFLLDDLAAMDAVPWAESIAVARNETLRAVEQALRSVMFATTRLDPDEINLSGLDPQSRLARHLQGLVDVWRAADGALPDDLHVVRHVLNSASADALEALPLVDHPQSDLETALERHLREHLVSHHGFVPEGRAQAWRDRMAFLSSKGPAGSSLRRAIKGLSGEAVTPAPLDGSIQFLALRDYAEEAEFAAALAQKLVADGLSPRDIGLLVPIDLFLCQHLDHAFARVGIPLSGLPGAGLRRDLAAETLLLLLVCVDRPAPAMALASLYTSPLMPWSVEIGRGLAREVMRGRYSPRAANQLIGRSQSLFKLLGQETPGTPEQLFLRLEQFVQTMNDAPDVSDDVTALRRAIKSLREFQQASPELNLVRLRREVSVCAGTAVPVSRNVEGVTVLVEGAAPWRPVRQLMVLGMASGRFPRSSSVSPFFLDSELTHLAERTGLKLPTRADQLRREVRLFQEQLSVASERCVFLHPWRSPDGKRQLPSAGLSLLARTILDPQKGQSIDDVTMLMQNPKLADGGRSLVGMGSVPAQAGAPTLPQDGKLLLGRDLFAVRRSSRGEAATQSPSRLENLLVSPLAWALAEFGAEPLVWAPEKFDPATAGTLAHEVFEHLFKKNALLPDEAAIDAVVPQLLAAVIRNRAPFLGASAWKVERQGLERDVIRSAKRWRTALEAAGASVLANEFDLAGMAFGLNLFGRVDCLLQLPGNRLLVVDHKKSSSPKRKARMSAGWDLQAALYRHMLYGLVDGAADLLAALSSQPQIGIAYHLMNDSGILVHGFELGLADFDVLTNDVAAEAEARLLERIGEARLGTITLNEAGDAKFYKSTANLSPYALENNPLVTAFTLPKSDQAPEGELQGTNP